MQGKKTLKAPAADALAVVDMTDSPQRNAEKTEYENDNLATRFASIRGLDSRAGLSRANNQPEVYERSLRLVMRRFPKILEDMAYYLMENNLKELAVSAHGLKGSLANIGESRCGVIARELESAALSGRSENCGILFSELWEALDDFFEVLNEILPEKPKTREAGDEEALLAALTHSISHIENYQRSKALDALSEALKYSYGDEKDKKLNELTNALESYDYHIGLKIAREMAANV